MSGSAFSKALLAGALGSSLFVEGSSAAPVLEDSEACAIYQSADTTPNEILPPLSPEFPDQPNRIIQIGVVAVKNGEFTMGGDLPTAYRKALAFSIAEPLTGCMVAKYAQSGVNMYQWGNGEDGLVPPGSNEIRLYLTDRPDNHRVYTTSAAMRRVLTHESTHTFFNAWVNAANNGNKEAQQAVAGLNSAYTARSETVFEGMRREWQAKLSDTVTTVRDESEKRGHVGIANAAQELLTRLSRPDGLRGITTFCPPGSHAYCEINYLTDMLAAISDRQGGEPLDRVSLDLMGIDIAPLDAMDNRIDIYMQRHFSISDESRVFGASEATGHPFANSSEYMASILAADQNDPERVVQLLNKLPSEERAEELRMRQAIVQGTELTDPSLLPSMRTVSVLKAFF